ncbi:hypothetical protein CVT25_005630 [Psilocybe cyanescens]|uniref:Uncharacterized protein n=1 Tax=Psilocybe cyanescens TaxID=93625 RepID=A0A409X6C2_PSICY|nr:hypothetical protein CVT25_005630 [Psilocybe cyanescens]
MQLTTFLTTLLVVATASVVAAPIKGPQELIVFNPPITSPKASAAWAKGSEQIVRWNTDEIPESRMNSTGIIVLGYAELASSSEHLDIEHPLATGFSISQGSMKVVMPTNIPARNDYFVVLFGDSGNRSPKFRIH